jgi:acyl carrier protein
MFTTIRRLIEQETSFAGRARALRPQEDLYEAGMTSLDAMLLLVAVEREFKVEFDCDSVTCKTTASIEAIARSVMAKRQTTTATRRKLRLAA